MFENTKIRKYKNLTIQMFENTNVRQYKSSGKKNVRKYICFVKFSNFHIFSFYKFCYLYVSGKLSESM